MRGLVSWYELEDGIVVWTIWGEGQSGMRERNGVKYWNLSLRLRALVLFHIVGALPSRKIYHTMFCFTVISVDIMSILDRTSIPC